MKRKLIKQGAGGITVCLPKRWVSQNNLGAGDELEILEDGKTLHLTTKKVLDKKLELNLDYVNKHEIRCILSYAYNAGYNKIKLNFKTLPKPSMINTIVSSFTGLEVTEQEKNSITIQSFFRDDDEQIEKLIIKMFQFTNHILDEIDQKWTKADVNLLGMYDYLLKMRDHCLRTIQIHQYQGEKSYYHYYFVIELTKISRSFSYLGRAIKESNLPRSKLFSNLKKTFNELYQCYLKKDFSKTDKVWLKIRKNIQTEIGFTKLNKSKENKAFLVHYYDCLLKLSECFSSILGIQTPLK